MPALELAHLPEADVVRIMLIDDEPAIHDGFERIIRKQTLQLEGGGETVALPIKLDCFISGEDALESLKQIKNLKDEYALIFVDLFMHEGRWDGLQTIQHIWEDNPHARIVLITGASQKERRDIWEVLPPSNQLVFLAKPFEIMEIRQIIRVMATTWFYRLDVQNLMKNMAQQIEQNTKELVQKNQMLENESMERQRTEVQLRHKHKLEAVGQLASGIAHEINTPMQFLSDSVCFMQAAFDDYQKFMSSYNSFIETIDGSCDEQNKAIQDIKNMEEELDIEYLNERIPTAIERTLEGIDRVATIVRAMKSFAHPAQTDMKYDDVNKAIDVTLTVAKNEYKYIADVETEYGEIPQVLCQMGEINQVLLNIIVNAAHAIEEKVAGTDQRGTITIKTYQENEFVAISIKDTGAGIPEEIINRIYDPFFTTKEVGKGTGQGLAIARNIIEEQHGGQLICKSVPGESTTFIIKLHPQGPIKDEKNV